MRKPAHRKAGFTIVEMMVVVVILAVISAVALVAYRQYIKRARSAEAAGLLSDIRARQESYRAEFGIYCNVAEPHPGTVPTNISEEWTGTANWRELGFVPDVMYVNFQLNTVAGPPNSGPGWGDVGLAANFTDFWFAARAEADQDADGENSVFWTTSQDAVIGSRRAIE